MNPWIDPAAHLCANGMRKTMVMGVGARLTIESLKLFSTAYTNRGGRTVSRDTAFDYLKILVC
jgi:hypothetical protein